MEHIFLLIDAIFVSSIAFLCTFFLIPIVCWYSHRYKLVDVPDGVIKTHKGSIPNLGGLAVYIGFILASFRFMNWHDTSLISFLIGITLFLVIGLVDDRVCLNPAQKFFGQCIASLFFLRAGLHFWEPLLPRVINLTISLLWLVTIMNGFNLIDIMDGLAATVAIGITITLLAIAFYIKATTLIFLLTSFLGALIAFLWYNKPAASIYLGDAGALFIGGFLAGISFLYPWNHHNQFGYLILFSVFFIPLYELVSLIMIRTYKKIPFFLPSPDHFSMYLLRNGWHKKSILWYVGSMSLLVSIVSFLFFIQMISIIVFSIFWVFFSMFWMFILTNRTA